ncbi:nuclear transport factor 2 family protein [Salinimonas sediminis]|uniref:DUF2358 domain-containing protein n=1 Tax=Salinimonas sediminis TaxID=2303538 RepID=A0A346NNR7_9ALTE|nr:nuclear transport factor 2 family protein [Salinimonas sediminis]AXR07174.1 DUF2358 domain-containing protein [Salinimonas sediminis]
MSLIESFCTQYRDLTKISSEDLTKIYTTDVEFIDPIDHHHGLSQVQLYFAKLKKHATSCKFDIHNIMPCEPNQENISYVLSWTMALTLKKSHKVITLEGITKLKQNEGGFYYHRDYYDMGEMVYEHVPVLRWFIIQIKRKLRS